MIWVATLCLVAGIALGLRFRVYILVPTVFFTLAAIVGTGIANDRGIWGIVLDALVGTVTLELGYVVGVAFQALAAGLRQQRRLKFKDYFEAVQRRLSGP